MLPFELRNYKIQIPQKACGNCQYSCNGGFPSNPLECEYPVELRKAIETGKRVIVDPCGICDGYAPYTPKDWKWTYDKRGC